MTPHILVLGNTGAGKTTVARALAARHDLVHLDLDTVVWEPGKVAVPRSEDAVIADLAAFVADTPGWVIEGSYGDWAEHLSPLATVFVFLDPGVETCLAHQQQRPWEPEKYDDPQEQARRLDFLRDWTRRYLERDDRFGRAWHRRVFDAFARPKVIITDDVDADTVVARVEAVLQGAAPMAAAPTVFDHLSISVSDLEAAVALYDAALAPLGLVRLFRARRAAGYGPPGFTGEAPFAIVVPRQGAATPSPAAHLAFRAASREAVQGFHAAALAHGARDDGPPGIRGHYDAGYYAAFIVDPDGNRLEAVVHETIPAQPSPSGG